MSKVPVRTWRKNWKYPTSILCIYGFFSTIKPMEPFLVPYLTGPDKNLTAQQPDFLLRLQLDFRECFASKQLLYWSLWWVMASCGFNQTVNFIQVLWEHVQPSQNSSIYNGGVEAVSSILSTASVYGIGYREERWEQWGELALAGFSGLCSVALFVMTFSSNIWISYASYIVFKCLYMVLMTIAMFHIATELTMERYALVFGANTFGALVLQTILTSIVVDSGGLALGIIPQFIVYASYFSLITAVFLLRGLYTIRREKKNRLMMCSCVTTNV
uniref:Solute carrier family 19 member 3a n=1 Tax=Takifugu rubripes TaxID=31033 RepID=A0A674P348_TAKRU